jgi:hypothetical protein
MVESNPFDEDWGEQQDPYDMALNSDEETEQLRTVSQEDDPADSNEDAPRKSVVSFSDGSKKSPATSGADPTTLVGSSKSPATSGASKSPATSGASKSPATSGATRSVTSGSKASKEVPARSEYSGSNAPQENLTRTTTAASVVSPTTTHQDTTAASAVSDAHGMLRQRIMQLLPKRSTPPEQEAKYIQKWCKLITAGWEGFTRELLVERSKANPKPLVFAVITNGDQCIQLAHGFGILALESDQHPSNGLIGCFVGDRVITEFQGETIIQEPQFVTLMDTDMISGITTKPAADGAIKKLGMSGGLLKGSPKASQTEVPAFLPLPLAWVPYFLEKSRSNTEAYCYMSKKLAYWQKGTVELRECGTGVLDWFRAACTLDPVSPDYSITDLSTRPLPKDNETTQWSMAHLQSTVPRPAPRAPTPTPQGQQTSLHIPPAPPQQLDQTAVLCARIMALSESILSSQVERERPSETAKKLSEVETCRLLGYCGLAWSERHLLPAIWTDLKKQADRASREAVLAAFFAKLAEKEPSLRYFNNQALFEDIINHRFLPGDTYETCHKGLSPLAFLPKSFADIHDDKMAEDYYNEATVKTVTDVRKHRTKGPPPIPMNDAELLRLNTRDVIVLEALFTEWSALVRQEMELNRGLHDQQMDLFSNPDSTREMIPNFLWAKIKARRNISSRRAPARCSTDLTMRTQSWRGPH